MLNQYILLLLWIGAMVYVQRGAYRREYFAVSGEYEWRIKPVFAVIMFLPIIFMAAGRGWFGDTSLYIYTYRRMPDTFGDIATYISSVKKDKGFYLVMCVLRVILGYNHYPYLLIVAILQGSVIIWFFRKYSTNYNFCVFLFVATTDYISWMFNGIRQFSAVTIILLATPFMLKKKWIPLIVMTVLASTMHQSALIVLPLVYIALGQPWNKKTMWFMAVIILAITFVSAFTSILNDALQVTQYANVVSDYTSWNDNGTHPLRVLVYSIPALISFVYRKQICEKNNILINFCTNMSIISMGLYIISMVTSGIFLGRLPIYCSLYSFILLSWELEYIIPKKNKKTVIMASVIGFILYYFFLMHFQNSLI